MVHLLWRPLLLQTYPGPLFAKTGYDLSLFTNALYPAIVVLILTTATVGIFTGLALFAFIVLADRGLRKRSVFILFVVTFLMYASAVAYWVALFFNAIGMYNVVQVYASQSHCLAVSCQNVDAIPGPLDYSMCTQNDYGLSGTVRGLTTCAPTIILAVNVLLGDAIVWWRVWVLWPNSLLVRATCLILLFTTFSASLFDVNDSCPPSAFSTLQYYNLEFDPNGSLFEHDLWGLAASALSLATNVVATALIGIKAWEHRKFVSTATLKRKGRVERVLTLFIESGSLYCLLWGFVVAYQVASEQQWKHAPSRYTAVLNGFDYFLKGCLIPLVGIYPTAIIVLVALNKSHFVGSTLEMTAVMTTVVFQNPETTMNSMGYSSMASSDHLAYVEPPSPLPTPSLPLPAQSKYDIADGGETG